MSKVLCSLLRYTPCISSEDLVAGVGYFLMGLLLLKLRLLLAGLAHFQAIGQLLATLAVLQDLQ
jgi:hypothetical protein